MIVVDRLDMMPEVMRHANMRAITRALELPLELLVSAWHILSGTEVRSRAAERPKVAIAKKNETPPNEVYTVFSGMMLSIGKMNITRNAVIIMGIVSQIHMIMAPRNSPSA